MNRKPGRCTGSSPRVRGKRRGPGEADERGRIIPARAGQTSPSTARPRNTSDHPRACGANPAIIGRGEGDGGSSPRVRGKHAEVEVVAKRLRIIPARAGQTTRHPGCCRTPTDHPRACGANCIKAETREGFIGSSPRVRGKPEELVVPVDCRRIIPARAGQTPAVTHSRTQPPDHPRACGANANGFGVMDPRCGSSPRVRGKPV